MTGALPGEVVDVEVVQQRRDFARAVVRSVVEPSPDRVAPVCPAVALGCGGCGWQHVDPLAQPRLKRAMVVDALTRLGRIADADALVHAAPALPAGGHRTTVRVAVADQDGRPGFRAASSHRVVPVTGCPAAHPSIDALLRESRFAGADEVTLRVGAKTGEGLVVADPSADHVRVAGWPGDPSSLVVTDVAELDARGEGDEPRFHEEVAGVRLQVSASAFSQTRHDGAEALVGEVDAAIGSAGAGDGRASMLYDLYGGGGLIAATVGRRFDRVITVERDGASHADALVNLAGRPGVWLEADDVDRWRPSHEQQAAGAGHAVVVADPSRAGLGRAGVASVAACDPSTVVLVSCDAAAAGRDLGLLAAEGYVLERSTVVDLFPWTPHVEVVSRLVRDQR